MAKKIILGIVFLHKRVKRWVVFNFHNLQWKLNKITLTRFYIQILLKVCPQKKYKALG